MIVGDLIGVPVNTCTPTATVQEAARRMLALDIGSLAVVDDDRLVGIVTERDLLGPVARPATVRCLVSEVMTPDPDTLSSDVEVEDAAAWMMAAGYRHLPVVDDGQLAGMVSIKDLMWALTERWSPRIREG